jgi:hypothetical protein
MKMTNDPAQTFAARTLPLFTAAFISLPTCAASPLQPGLNAGFTFDDNVTRAQYENDQEDDYYLAAGGSITYSHPVTERSYATINGTLEANQYHRFDKLSNTRLGVRAGLHYKPFTGFTAIRYSLEAAYIERMYKSDQRDGSETQIKLNLAKKLTDRMSLNAGYIRQNIDANSDIFDADNNRIYLDLETMFTNNNVGYLTLGYFDGDMVTTARSGLGIDYRKWVIDDAFSNLQPTRWAYKLSGDAISLRAGDVYVFNRYHSLDGSVFYYDASADNNAGSYYKGYIYSLNYLYRF